MDISYRPARLEDLESAAGLVQETYNDLRVRHGLAPVESYFRLTAGCC